MEIQGEEKTLIEGDDITERNLGDVTPHMLASLKATKPWVRVYSLFGFLAAFLVAGFPVMVLIKGVELAPDYELPTEVLIEVGASMISALFLLASSALLWRYGSAIRELLDGGGEIELEDALSRQKSYWRLMGFMSSIILILMIIGLVAAIGIPLLVARIRLLGVNP